MSMGGYGGQTYSPQNTFNNPFKFNPNQYGGMNSGMGTNSMNSGQMNFSTLPSGMGYAGTSPVMQKSVSQNPADTLMMPMANGQKISLPNFNPNPPVGNQPPPTPAAPAAPPAQPANPFGNGGMFGPMQPPPTTPMQPGQAYWGWDGGSANNGYTQRFNPRENLYIQQMIASDPSIRGKIDPNNYLSSIGQLTGRQYSASDPQWNV